LQLQGDEKLQAATYLEAHHHIPKTLMPDAATKYQKCLKLNESLKSENRISFKINANRLSEAQKISQDWKLGN
jgi:hypothetical protein